jgi:hypothetical protein
LVLLNPYSILEIVARMLVASTKIPDSANKIVSGAIPPDEKSSTPGNSRVALNSRGLKNSLS